METVKCKLLEYRGVHYLSFDDGRKAKVGDRVLASNIIPLQYVDSLCAGYDDDGFGYLSNSGGVKHLFSQLPIVVAVQSELHPADFDALLENPNCLIFESDGNVIMNGEEILIAFEEIDSSGVKVNNNSENL